MLEHNLYKTMPLKDIKNLLIKRGIPAMERKDILDQARELKAEARATRSSAIIRRQSVGELLTPLRYEARLVRRMQKYEGAPERDTALAGYLKVLDALEERLNAYWATDEQSLSDYVREKNVPNNGAHWTDFVPTHIKQRVNSLFSAIPPKAKARVKVPFERKVPMSAHYAAKDRLKRRTIKELNKVLAVHNAMPTGRTEDIVADMRRALDLLDKLNEHEPVPTTWKGLV
jgi:hypothetical protein